MSPRISRGIGSTTLPWTRTEPEGNPFEEGASRRRFTPLCRDVPDARGRPVEMSPPSDVFPSIFYGLSYRTGGATTDSGTVPRRHG